MKRGQDGKFIKGSTPWNKGIEYTAIQGEKNPAKRPEVRAKLVFRAQGRVLSEETRLRIGSILKGQELTAEHKENISRGVANSPIYREALSRREVLPNSGQFKKGLPAWNKGKRGTHFSPATEFSSEGMRMYWADQAFRQKMGRKWKDPEYKERWMRAQLAGLFRRPTGLEQRFTKFITEHDLPFRYCGNGSLLIGFKNPDFVETNGRKICLEIANKFHHPGNYEDRRVNHFAKWGWTCLVIWQEELDKPLELLKRLKGGLG